MAQLKISPSRMNDSTLVADVDDGVVDLEQDLAAIFGIPQNTVISAALFEVVAAGLKSLLLQDAAAVPDAGHNFRRNGKGLQFYDGTKAQDIVQAFDKDRSAVAVENTVVPTNIYSITVPANTLGTDHVLEFDIYGFYSLLGLAEMLIEFLFGGTVAASIIVVGSSTEGVLDDFIALKATLFVDGATDAQKMYIRGEVGNIKLDPSGGTNHAGFRVADGPTSDVSHWTAALTKDSTSGQIFSVRVTFSAAAPTNRITRETVFARRM